MSVVAKWSPSQLLLSTGTFGKVTGKMVVSHAVCLVREQHKDEEFTVDFAYDIKKLLLTVVTLVSPLILTILTNFD